MSKLERSIFIIQLFYDEVIDLMNQNFHFLARQPAKFLFELGNLLAAPADDDARARRPDEHPDLVAVGVQREPEAAGVELGFIEDEAAAVADRPGGFEKPARRRFQRPVHGRAAGARHRPCRPPPARGAPARIDRRQARLSACGTTIRA